MRVVALVFDGGKVTMLIERATQKDAGKVFRKDIAEIRAGGPGRVALREVKGSPAFVAWPRTDAVKANPALVEFYQNGLDIHLISTKVGPSTLLAIADTVAFRKA
jgi:hypothetical protein